jgi:hypothetical protein
MYTIMGCVVGVGVVIFRKYPQVSEFVKQYPILGWTLTFAAGSVALTVSMTLVAYKGVIFAIKKYSPRS